ncbi:asparagine synthetase B family protein [Emticicia sp. 17c]|uniref:asparagine synthetase B family protein n=1 Tax=Emticicia sp. 17c TaxID=3127704 RepID=UPI00301BE038
MSLIFGIVRYETHADGDFFEAMYEPLRDFPQVRFHKAIQHEAAFGKLLTFGTPEDTYDAQPVYLSEPNILFVAQGRIDNRDELSQSIGVKADAQVADSYFILQAYLKYGEETQHKLKGDWSFVAYHFNTKELFVARDTMGYSALFFYKTDKYLAFSSSVKAILALPDFKKELNDEYLISLLSLWKVREKFLGDETFYKNVFSLQIGFVLKLKNRAITVSQYWPPENIKEIYYKNKQDYSDQMSELVYKAVNRRLRSNKPVASMLSGGLDSSMVSYVAADLLKQQNKTLTTLSHVPLYKNNLSNHPMAQKRVLDETPFISAIIKAAGNINPLYLTSESVSPWQGSIEMLNIIDGFIHGAGNAYWMLDIYKTAAQAGYGTLLTGEGGNGSTSFVGLDYKRPHSVRRFLKKPVEYLKRQVAKPLVLKYFSTLSVFNTFEKFILESYLATSALDKYNVMDEARKKNQVFLQYYANVLQFKKNYILYYRPRSVLGATMGHYYGIELRDPTTDKDLMDFFLAIPNEVFFDEHFNSKMLVKRMMANKIPDEVLYAKNKGLQSSDLIFRVRESKTEVLNAFAALKNSALVQDYINVNKLEKNLQAYLDSETVESTDTIHVLIKTMQAADFLMKRF